MRGPDATLHALLDIGAIEGYWPLDERSGSIARDLVKGNHGTYTGGVLLGHRALAADGLGCARFDGSTGYVTIPDRAAYSAITTTKLTVGCWALLAPSGNDQSVLSKASAAFTYEYQFQLYATRQLWTYNLQSNGNECSLVSPATTLEDIPHLLGMTLDTSGAVHRQWIDGVEVGSDSTWTNAPADTAGVLMVGARADGPLKWYGGHAGKVFVASKAFGPDAWRYLWAIGRGG